MSFYACSICKRTSSSRTNLNVHIRSKHPGAKPAKCTFHDCSACFVTDQQLRQHVAEKHEGKLYAQCPYCHIKVLNECLMQHLINKHKSDHGGFPCPECKLPLDNPSQITQHILYAHTPGRLRCPINGCTVTFAFATSIPRHLEEQHQTAFKCTDCDKQFQTYPLMVEHRDIAHRDTRFPCPICLTTLKKRFQHRFKCFTQAAISSTRALYRSTGSLSGIVNEMTVPRGV